MLQQKIIKTGHSLAVTLPAKLVKSLGLKAGDNTKVTVAPDQSSISYHFDEPRQLSLDSTLKPTIS